MMEKTNLNTNSDKHRTWQVKRPFGKTIILALIALVLTLSILEISARIASGQPNFPMPSLGIQIREAEYKFLSLNQKYKEQGHILPSEARL